MSSTTLKLIALFFMLLDHIAEFIPGAPLWLHWIGRISAPLFMFCMVWGFHYTHDRKTYVKRMYLFGVGMAVMDLICNNICQKPYEHITNNIFVTLLSIALTCWVIDERKKDKKKGNKYLLMFVLYQIISTVLCVVISRFFPLYGFGLFMGAITANVILNEGSIIFGLLGVLMYYFKENTVGYIIMYTFFCIVGAGLTCLSGGFSYHNFFVNDYQWMMIGALFFMLSYNGKKGKGLKYLFYIFYPVHIFILFWLGNLIN